MPVIASVGERKRKQYYTVLTATFKPSASRAELPGDEKIPIGQLSADKDIS